MFIITQDAHTHRFYITHILMHQNWLAYVHSTRDTHSNTIAHMQDVSHDWVVRLAMGCSRLRDLDLSKCTQLTDRVCVCVCVLVNCE